MSPQPHIKPDAYFLPSVRTTLHHALIKCNPLSYLIPFESRNTDIMNNPEALIQQAEKLVAKGKSGWSFFGVSEERFEQAAACYRDAGQAYEMKGNFLDAAAAYIKAGETQEKYLKDDFEAPDSYVHASDAYRRALLEEVKPINDNQKAEAKAKAIDCRKKAIKLTESSSSSSKLRRLSRMYDAIGQIYEKDIAAPLVQAKKNLLSSKTLTPDEEKIMNALKGEPQPTPRDVHELQRLQSKAVFSNEDKAHLEWLESEMMPPLEEARNAYKEAADFIRLDSPLNANTLYNRYADLSVFIATLLPHLPEKDTDSTKEDADSTQKDARSAAKINPKNSHYEDALNAYAIIIKTLQVDPQKHKFSIPDFCLKWCLCRLAQCNAVATLRDVPKYQQIDMEAQLLMQTNPNDHKIAIAKVQGRYTPLFDLNEAIRKKDRGMIDVVLQGNPGDEWQKKIYTDIQNKWEVEDEFA
ncbi:uncharacterized protein Triagg1_7839 [Trichoderma aggressivum f. europaeum]|uniref:Gamma-soluble NSF attachment protein n=1 Tax=Trichoderma aggressivum f. europaeum TaxID=173218 RepID=A0AAE1M2E7_9HYPO|nr:hypothetical protein Triagg1_7839 [Trichoderma aggressivum f. europaeum]